MDSIKFTQKDYDKIKRICTKLLVKGFHSRHLEDAIQYVCMKYFEKNCRANIEWLFYDYLRESGIGKRGKVCAKTIELSTFVGRESDEQDHINENNFLFQKYAEEKDESEKLEKEELEESIGLKNIFQEVLNINNEVFEWVICNLKIKSLSQQLGIKKKI